MAGVDDVRRAIDAAEQVVLVGLAERTRAAANSLPVTSPVALELADLADDVERYAGRGDGSGALMAGVCLSNTAGRIRRARDDS